MEVRKHHPRNQQTERGSSVSKSKPMTGEQFEKIIYKLGFNQNTFAATMGVNDRTVRSWISERFPVPRPIAMLLNLMVANNATPEDLKP